MNVCLVQPGRDFSPSQLVESPLKDAGLKPSEVDGFLAIEPADDPRRSYALSVAQAAGICPSYATSEKGSLSDNGLFTDAMEKI